MTFVRLQWELRLQILIVALLLGGGGSVWAQGAPVRPPSGNTVASAAKIVNGLKKTPIPEHSEYKVDKEYQKILEYDYLPYWFSQEKEIRLDDSDDLDPTIRNQDKAMVLTGKGFQIPDLQRFKPDPGIEINPYRHIDIDAPQPPLYKRRDRLDSKFAGAVHQKELIFHPHVSGFHNVKLPQLEEDPKPVEYKLEVPLEVDESRMLLWSERETRLTLTPGKRSWDLLHDDPYRARLDFAKANRQPRSKAKRDPVPSKKRPRTR